MKDINLLVCDVDGVMTDGGMYYDMQGNEWKKFNARDGKGIELLRKSGIKIMILTGEDTPIVKRRSEKLKADFCFMGIKDKKALLDEFFSQNDEFAYEKTAYIGDDVNDAECLKLVKFSAAPSDAAEENLQIVNYVCKKAGGQGCVREICDILRKNEAEIL